MTRLYNIETNKSGKRKSWTPPQLPQFYYHDHFCDMLRFVETRYSDVMGAPYQDIIPDFFDLPRSAQCIYARLASRKIEIFDTRKLNYPEIGSLDQGLAHLKSAGWITEIMAEDWPLFLSTISKAEVLNLLTENVSADLFKQSWKKDRIIEIALAELDFDALAIPDHFIKQGRIAELSFITFLFFGKVQENLQSFTLRDLGLIKAPDFKSDYQARFDSVEEAGTAFFYDTSNVSLAKEDNERIASLIDEIENWPVPVGDAAQLSAEKLIFELGRLSERLGDTDTALDIYDRSPSHKCAERIIRIRYARGEKDWCQKHLESMMDDPDSDDAYEFAVDFYQRKFGQKRTSSLTKMLRQGDLIRLEEGLKHAPEYAIKMHFEALDYEVYRSENAPWRMLFGLLFWDELFLDPDASLHNAFDRLPISLKTGDFYRTYENKIEAKLGYLSHIKETQLSLLKTMTRHYGTPNGIFRWDRQMFEAAKALVKFSPQKSLASIMRQIAQNYQTTKDGFPDIVLIKDGHLKLVEVKSTGDVIRRNQLTRIKQLRSAGYDVDIARIEWAVCPNQIYVVVDIETTGGRGQNHRITEIGAVKVQNGKVIDEYQTLLNPERHIPQFITGLTGITNEMVRGAPRFEEVAKDLRTFLHGSIFVAHNVNFDYGFIKAEYGRLGEKFSYPKLCTVTSMRRYFPGLKSYSLGKLCREFSINLVNHHRAMSDAKAAAELLFLINDKRQNPDDTLV